MSVLCELVNAVYRGDLLSVNPLLDYLWDKGEDRQARRLEHLFGQLLSRLEELESAFKLIHGMQANRSRFDTDWSVLLRSAEPLVRKFCLKVRGMFYQEMGLAKRIPELNAFADLGRDEAIEYEESTMYVGTPADYQNLG